VPRECDDANSVRQIARRHVGFVRAWLASRDLTFWGDRDEANEALARWADSAARYGLAHSPRADAKGVG
jgi:hypothetical protein